jgi:hypothetical protein
LGQLLAFAHRTIVVKFDHFKQRFSPRKLIPTQVKSLGDYLLLKRIQADLSQPELAIKANFTLRKVMAMEHDRIVPTHAEWQNLTNILKLEDAMKPTP